MKPTVPATAERAAIEGAPVVLTDEQLSAFDHDALENYRLKPIVRSLIVPLLTHEGASFADVGGGTGRFADFVLSECRHARGVVIDNSPFLLGKNLSSDRKTTILADAMRIDDIGRRYDVVFCNFFLHHLVDASYRSSRALQEAFLAKLHHILAPGGHLFIIEELKDGWFGGETAVRLIHRITRIRCLAPLIRRLGANTAGTGVCFYNRRGLERVLKKLGFAVVREHRCAVAAPLRWRLLLGLRRQESGAILVVRRATDTSEAPVAIIDRQ